MNAIADVVIALACFAIPFVLIYVARRRKDLPLNWLTWAFSFGVVAAGIMHVLTAWNVWHTHHWVEAVAKVLTALSVIPSTIGDVALPARDSFLPSQRRLARTRTIASRAPNRELEALPPPSRTICARRSRRSLGQAGLLELALGATATDDQKRRLRAHSDERGKPRCRS